MQLFRQLRSNSFDQILIWKKISQGLLADWLDSMRNVRAQMCLNLAWGHEQTHWGRTHLGRNFTTLSAWYISGWYASFAFTLFTLRILLLRRCVSSTITSQSKANKSEKLERFWYAHSFTKKQLIFVRRSLKTQYSRFWT